MAFSAEPATSKMLRAMKKTFAICVDCPSVFDECVLRHLVLVKIHSIAIVYRLLASWLISCDGSLLRGSIMARAQAKPKSSAGGGAGDATEEFVLPSIPPFGKGNEVSRDCLTTCDIGNMLLDPFMAASPSEHISALSKQYLDLFVPSSRSSS